jgi:radical SAM protein with 4Fe4S-binding SPASM domain
MTKFSMSGNGPAQEEFEFDFFRQHNYTLKPRFIQWMATLRCKMNCPHCLAADQPMEDMALSTVDKLLEQVVRMNIAEFLITGGEPTCRPDLPEVIDMLHRRSINWTLNTAANPGPRLKSAIEKHPPRFVAVSLDGPEKIHDSFRGQKGAYRESLEAIAYYRSIVDGEVVAGTTVTACNYSYLEDTFLDVIQSGATAWGLHLLVPEGRAKKNNRLFLSRQQTRGMVDFCAARRKYFPVGMADEIGYLGEEEPLVREQPFFCGAGRTQCVVLPNGEVVPCTTLDVSASAGNILEQELSQIWASGFSALRNWQPSGACRSCQYAPACRGGCWLQRKNGTQCFKQIWRAPRLAGAAAGLAVCFGLSSVQAGEAPPREPAPVKNTQEQQAQETASRIKKSAIEAWIVCWYAACCRGRRARSPQAVRLVLQKQTKKEAANSYCLDVTNQQRKRDLVARCKSVDAGLKTQQVSLSLAALMWRDLAETCLDGRGPAERTKDQRQKLRNTLTALDKCASQWWRQTYEEKLGPFLIRGMAGCYSYKGGPGLQTIMFRALNKERWGDIKKVTNAYVKAHPFGESMEIEVNPEKGADLRLLVAGREQKLVNKTRLRIFNQIITPAGQSRKLTVATGTQKLTVVLPPDCELTYADLLKLIYQQNQKAIDGNPSAINRKFALPALRKAIGENELDKKDAKKLKIQRTLVDIWLF